MTLEGFERARELDRLIREAKDNKRGLEDLTKRVEKVGETHFKGIAIKVNESWCYTPEGSVDISDFINFLSEEINCLDNIIAVYEKEFAKL